MNPAIIRAFGTMIGRISKNENRYSLKRIRINTFDKRSFFEVKTEGGYDWFHSIQYLSKKFKKLLP